MRRPLKTAGLFITLLLSLNGYGQSSAKQQADAKAKALEAIRLEDEEGKYEEAIILLREAEQLDPGNFSYNYELAYAYQGKEDYAHAATILEKLLQHKQVNARVYQMLGNTYDYMGRSDSAINTYNAGLKKFPAAGELYLELGNIERAKKEYEKALPYYEKGIEVAPAFASNYFWASLIYCSSDHPGWGLLYGELFMNLERNSKRTEQISKVLYDTYLENLKATDSSASVTFFKINKVTPKQAKKGKMPFSAEYEIKMSLALVGQTTIDLDALSRIRSSFVELYYGKQTPGEAYPNVLFAYQRKLADAGLMDAYSHWLLMKGDEAAFAKWKRANQAQWDTFTAWYTDHPLELNAKNRFSRSMYEPS